MRIILTKENPREAAMNLSQIKPGQKFLLDNSPAQIRKHFVRMGFKLGDALRCINKIPGGAILLQKDNNACQLAIGRDFAQQIIIHRI